MNGTKIKIRPKKTISLNDFKEIWVYKELLYFLTWRDLKVKYKQTMIGVAWALFQPFITMVIFSIFFGRMLEVPSDGIPYPIFVYTGLLFWQFFSTSLTDISNILVNNQSIITKVYFPRLILPIASTLTKFVDFIIASGLLIVLMIYYNYSPNLVGILIIPVLVLITFFTSIGLGLFLSAINVKYRDVRYVLPFFIQSLLFVTPVIYPASAAGNLSWLLAMNPMTGVISAARAAILGNAPINWELLGISFLVSLILLVIGVIFFKKTERYFADIV